MRSCRAIGQRQVVDVRLQRQPHFSRAWKIKAWRHHTDDRVTAAVERKRLFKGAGVSAKLSLPKPVTDQGHWRPARFVVGGRKSSTEHRFEAESRQVIRHR